MFNERKVAQMAAFFLARRGGRMSHLKLMKLLYLADRESLRRYAMPLSGDRMVSMPHGPVLSRTLDLMDGNVPSSPCGWEEWISDKENHEVSLNENAACGDFDELSPADLEILEEIWAKFGKMGRWEIRDFTHENCPEWEDPNESAQPITYKRVLTVLGYKPDQASALEEQIEEERSVERLFASL
jgi:uncharacterized phage-associated protein